MSRPPRPVTPIGLLAQALERLAARDGLDPDLSEELHAAHALAAGLEPYAEQVTSPESPALAELARRTRERDWDIRSGATVTVEQEMLSGHVEGKLLQFLIRLSRARRILEIGMFTGYSALAAAEAAGAGSHVVACELDPEVAAFAQEMFDATPAGARIEVRVGPATETLSDLQVMAERFDLVFIDADKPGYLRYVQTVLDFDLLAPAGLICVDNTLLQGEPYRDTTPSANGTAIRDFNAAIAADPRVEQVLLTVRDGITLIRRI